MTSSAGITLEELEILTMDNRSALNVTMAAIALFLFDSLLTLSDEIKFIWGKPWTAGGVVYLLARYGLVLQNILQVMVSTSRTTSEKVTCTQDNIAITVIDNISAAGVIGLTLVTTWIIARKKTRNLVLLCTTATLLAGSLLAFLGFTDCKLSDPTDSMTALYPTFKLCNQIFLILFEFCATGIVLESTWRLYLETIEQAGKEVTLLRLFVKKGDLIFVWDILDVISDKPTLVNFDVPLHDVITTILLCRFFLEICKTNEELAEDKEESEGALTTNADNTFIPQSIIPKRRNVRRDITSLGIRTSLDDEDLRHIGKSTRPGDDQQERPEGHSDIIVVPIMANAEQGPSHNHYRISTDPQRDASDMV
ncbi:hypothetical protein M422DRAFT_28786 [Sphaerobolus stellatus SS14]|nr:hypothetical protein M422DRAFT_28786 [Sphaerobolus stellatus SS14]